ncbi:MAG: hypothetical protein QOI62_2259 [Solirubrobacteraceae bacterium]|jgi:hypothetical protein|nr:hypothetical protein [Solirubrobacteraceae bacterium]MEA2277186.1 hypothetical protein [Solirubrobacteraceae bacterium]MEA2358999.1 hypothetical protein [Solirubrobacteraceae bacterium]MEA2394374.1 hypothetical protein [Solirubrobacteraceae bacterium]
MSEVRISPVVQLLLLMAVLSGVGALIGVSLPEIRRYLKIRSM